MPLESLTLTIDCCLEELLCALLKGLIKPPCTETNTALRKGAVAVAVAFKTKSQHGFTALEQPRTKGQMNFGPDNNSDVALSLEGTRGKLT